MRRALLTLSGLQLAATCPGSAVLPRIGSTSAKADIGSALHEYNAIKGERGKHAADAQADEIADRWGLDGKERSIFFARARSLELQIPSDALYEVPLCLRANGTVEPVTGARGEYVAPDDAIVAGTLDILFATPEPIDEGRWCMPDSVLWTPDLKTGDDANVAPIARNWQARVSALMGARWTGAEAVVPAIVFPSANGGSWDVPMRNGEPVPLRRDELKAIETDVRQLHATVTEQAARVDAGKLPRLVTGSHCTYCPARAGCPAHVAEARAIVTGQSDLSLGPLTREQAIKAAGLLGPARKALESMEKAVKAFVEANGAIALPDGRVYGPHPGEDASYNARAAYDAMVAEFEPGVGYDKAVELADGAMSTSKSAIYDAIAEAHELAGMKRQKEAAFNRIVANDGVTSKKPTKTWGARYPKTTEQ